MFLSFIHLTRNAFRTFRPRRLSPGWFHRLSLRYYVQQEPSPWPRQCLPCPGLRRRIQLHCNHRLQLLCNHGWLGKVLGCRQRDECPSRFFHREDVEWFQGRRRWPFIAWARSDSAETFEILLSVARGPKMSQSDRTAILSSSLIAEPTSTPCVTKSTSTRWVARSVGPTCWNHSNQSHLCGVPSTQKKKKTLKIVLHAPKKNQVCTWIWIFYDLRKKCSTLTDRIYTWHL